MEQINKLFFYTLLIKNVNYKLVDGIKETEDLILNI